MLALDFDLILRTSLLLTFFNIFSVLFNSYPLNEFLVPTIYRGGNYVFFVVDCNFAEFVKFVLFFEIVKLSCEDSKKRHKLLYQ